MANYSREDAEKQGKAEELTGAALLLGLGAMLVGGVVSSQNDKKKQEAERQKQEIDRQIREIDQKIAGYKSGLLGAVLYSDEIDALERKRKLLLEEQKKL